MTSKERVMMALDHKEPDKIPLDLGAGKACKFTRGFYVKLLSYLGLEEDIDICAKANQQVFASDEVLEKLGCDVRAARVKTIPVGIRRAKDWEDETSFYMSDDWGTTYRMPKNSPRYYDMCGFPLKDAEESADERYEFPTPALVKPECRKMAEDYQSAGYPVMVCEHFANGFLQTGPRLYGFNNWLAMIAGDEERACKFLDKLVEKKMQWWDNVFDVYGDTVDIVAECDDLGTQTGPFISMAMFSSLILPYFKQVFDHIRSRSNAKILLHCCGSVVPFLSDFINIGLDILNPVQITAKNMDPYDLKKEFGKDLTFWGGAIDTQKTLPFGTKQQVIDMVKRNTDAFAPGGGFIFTPVHAIQDDVPVENFMTMLETYREICRY
ncbi:MAG: uroporphyrinogen decarboxylase family protein [Oscillospiraceae bacterium]